MIICSVRGIAAASIDISVLFSIVEGKEFNGGGVIHER